MIINHIMKIKMSKSFISPLLFAAVLLFSACGTNGEDKADLHAEQNTETRGQWLAQIDSLEGVVYAENFDLEEPATGELLRAYLRYAKVFVADQENTPAFLYKAAALTRAVDLPARALKLYDQILTDYPDWEKAPETAFMVAFMYDDMDEKEQAREAYEEVIEKYAGDHWAVQAEERLKNLDMTDEELIEEFNRRIERERAGANQSSGIGNKS